MAIDRRRFIQSSFTLGAAAYLAPALRAATTLQRASVTDFGADPTGVKDSTTAVQKAIASLATTNARLVFPTGKYIFDSPEESATQAVLEFKGFDGIEVYANNAELRFAGAVTAFSFNLCHNVALHDMKVDWVEGELATGSKQTQQISCFALDQCEGVVLEGLAVQRSPGIAFAASSCRDLHMDSVVVAPAKGSRARSSSGHAIEISNCHGDIQVHDSRFEGMGGDGINVYQSYWKIRERADEWSVVIESSDGKPFEKGQMPPDGSFVQFSAPDTLLLMGEIVVKSVTAHEQGAKLIFAETLSEAIVPGMLVCSVVDGPKVVIDHCTIGNNSGSGVVVHSRSDITNNHLTGCGRAAILLAPDAERLQGPVVQNINIRTNTFAACNQGPGGDGRGVITIDAARAAGSTETPAFTLNSGVKIQNNIFKESGAPAIYAAGVDGLRIDGNTFGGGKSAGEKGHLSAALVLKNVADADVTGNTASVPQSIVMVQCADSISTDDNTMLTAEKPA